MTQRQWLNVIIITLAFSTLLFLFAHQRLTRNLPNHSQSTSALNPSDFSTIPALDTDSPIQLIQFGQHQHVSEKLMKHWQNIKLEPYYADLVNPMLQHSVKIVQRDEQQLFSIVLDQKTYYLIRHKDQQIFNLPHQTYVVLVPATYNSN
jgi:hypothetical protein